MTNFVLHLLNLNQANPTEKSFECSGGPTCHLVEKPCWLQWVGCCTCDRQKISTETVTLSRINKTAEWGRRMHPDWRRELFQCLLTLVFPSSELSQGLCVTEQLQDRIPSLSFSFLSSQGFFVYLSIKAASKVCPGVVPSFSCYAPELWQRCFIVAWRKWKGNRKPKCLKLHAQT